MSFFLIVPAEGRGAERAAELARRVGASRLSYSQAAKVLASMLAQAGDPPFSLGQWRLLEVPDGDPRRLSEISRFVRERIDADGFALVDLDERLISISELQEAATGLGLEVELVAVVKDHGKAPPPLAPEYQALLEAISALGGRNVSTGQIASHVSESPAKVRRRLQLLLQWRRIERTGRQGGSRYSLSGEEEK
ncbi:MAG TPA: hypothetical protein VHC97_10740 [Thermoanaerobaculia bacterium]|jgi:hypothetical protein|nr:hypothetical protein [Thermoanaerobaculia bacterium]